MTTLAQMAEIDLIPADYRNERALLRTVRMVGIVVLALVCIAATLSGVLRHAAGGIRTEVQRLDATAALVNQQRSIIAGLALRKGALESKMSLLAGLRRGAALEEILRSVGRAAPGDSMWFLEWRFERLGAIVPAAPAGAEAWFVVEPQSSVQAAPAVRVQMTIAGQARDHAAVSAFVSSLLGEPGIEEVRVQRASRERNEGLVEFNLLVVADNGSATE